MRVVVPLPLIVNDPEPVTTDVNVVLPVISKSAPLLTVTVPEPRFVSPLTFKVPPVMLVS